MGMTFRPPAASGGQGDVKALYSYLFQLAEQLNVAFDNVDAQGGGAAYRAMQLAGGAVNGEVDASTTEAYQNLKALIIKTATQVTSDIRKKYIDLAQGYLAQSEYGTYAEYLQAQIELGADGVIANWDQTNMITTSVADFNEYIAQSDVYMQIGIVHENENGTVEAGVVVGKNFQKVTIDGVETITSKDVYMLLTAEQISFWQDGVKRSSFSLEDFFVNKAYIDEVETSLISSETFGEELDITGNSSIELLNDRLALIVSSESSSTSLVLTDKMLQAIADDIDLSANESVQLIAGTPENLKNSSVTITPSMVQILTSLFFVQNEATGMTLDENGLSAEHVSAPNLQEKYTGPTSVTVGTGGDYGSMTSFASEISGKYIAENINVTVVSDLTGAATLRHVSGANVRIEGGGYSMYAPLNVENCTSHVSVVNLTLSYSGSVASLYTGSRVYLSGCIFNTSATARSGASITLDQGAQLLASNCQFYNTLGRLINIWELSRCVLEWCAGAVTTGPYAFALLTGSDLRSYGSYPAGTVYSDESATYTLNGTADSGTAQGTASALTTQEFTCTNSDTCRGSSDWDGSGYIWQGYTSTGQHYGYMWFDGLAAAISGKTINSATLKLKHVRGSGNGMDVTLKAYYSLKTTDSGSATVQTGYGGELGTINSGVSKEFDLPLAILTRMQIYGYGGICLYSGETNFASGKTFSRHYCKIYGANSEYAPVLTVTYQ